MNNLSRLFCTAENKIIILCAVKFRTESPDLLRNLPAHNKKMADIIVGAEQIQIEIRLQMGLEMLREIRCDLVLIGIEYVDPSVLLPREAQGAADPVIPAIK